MKTLRIEDILQSFYEISGMDVAIVNSKNKIIARRYSGALYCSTIHKSQKCMDICLESDKCGLTKAFENKDLYVYKCPFGIYEALMPISKNDEIVAYVFIGMGIEDNEESAKELMKNALDVSPTLNKAQLEKSINEMPRFSKEKLDAFASLMPLIAEYIETNNLLSDTDMTIGQLTKSYVKNNLSKKITLTDLAWQMHCSTVTLTEHFRNEYGITIMEYVMKKRMEKARRLLANSDLSIREVAEECGFSDNEYFSRCFKDSHGVSPTVWKKTQKSDSTV
jgi:AraC-like DNA-binding protein